MKFTHNAGPAPSSKELAARAAKLQDSRKRLLDLTLRNRLLNFRAGDPNHKDDAKTHKHMVFKAELAPLWSVLVEDEKEVCLNCLPSESQQQNDMSGGRLGNRRLPPPPSEERAVELAIPPADWKRRTLPPRSVDILRRGDLISRLSQETFKKRAARIRNEQNSLIDSTGDSALFLALGFLQWTEAAPHPKAGQPVFAPLLLLHVELQELRQEEGGERSYILKMDGDQPQDNPCLAAKLREFNIDLPVLEEGEDARAYLAKVKRAIQTKKDWAISDGVALGFFNFARYRLWLDLNPAEWPEGKAPANHSIVGAILDGGHLEQRHNIPGDEEVATTQSEDDLLTVLDADSTQYAALLAAKRGASLVVIGPPGSGKSQTITNLIAVALAEGKRVLFVAQKQAALQVVERNLKKVGIAQFCLPLFGEQARVTELHKHLAACRDVGKQTAVPKRPPNAAAPVARQLNAHAGKLAAVPAGHSCSISQIIRTAAALHLQVRDLWGDGWSEDLLAITTPDGEPSSEWIDSREQCLMEWHRLNSEVGGWGNWSPVELGPFDVGQVETAAQRYLEALEEIAVHCRNWPETVQWNLGKLSSASSQIAAAKLRELTTPIPALVAYLCEAPANQAKAAQFEQDLEELGRQRQQVARVLRVTPDAASSVIQRLGPASTLLSGLFDANCTLSRARELVTNLAGISQAAEDLLAHSSKYPKGVACLIPELAAGELQWRHLEFLANCTPSPLDLPSNVKLRLARHVQEDGGRLDKAKTLAVEMDVARQLQAEITASVGRIEAWRSPEAIGALRPLFSACADSSLGGVRVGDLPGLLPLIQQLAASIDGQMAAIAERTKLPANVCFYAHLGKLHRLTELQLRGPTDADWPWLAHAKAEHLIAAHLLEFASALEPVQGEFRRLQELFSDLRLEETSLRGTAETLSNAHGILRELGLVACTIGDVVSMAESTGKLESQLREAIGLCAQIFDRWQLRAPRTMDEVRTGCQLLRLLLNRPPAPSPETERAITSKSRIAALQTLHQERQALAEFAKVHGARIAFRDLPAVETVVQLRRELRAFGSSPFRAISAKYRQLRKQACGFLNAPFPSSADAILLLDKAEEYLQRTAKLQQHPDYSHLGSDDKRFEEYLRWLTDVLALAGGDDLSQLLSQAQDAPAIKTLLHKFEVLLDGLESRLTESPDFTDEGYGGWPGSMPSSPPPCRNSAQCCRASTRNRSRSCPSGRRRCPLVRTGWGGFTLLRTSLRDARWRSCNVSGSSPPPLG